MYDYSKLSLSELLFSVYFHFAVVLPAAANGIDSNVQ